MEYGKTSAARLAFARVARVAARRPRRCRQAGLDLRAPGSDGGAPPQLKANKPHGWCLVSRRVERATPRHPSQRPLQKTLPLGAMKPLNWRKSKLY